MLFYCPKTTLRGGDNVKVVRKNKTQDMDMELINKYSRRELNEDEVYTFTMVAADDQIDRDMERFTVKTLEELADLFKGTAVITDHNPKAENQTARVYNAYTESDGKVTRLMAQAYTLREGNEELINKIESGIIKEVSVGCAIKSKLCSACGKEFDMCIHQKGKTYNGSVCCAMLDGAADAYEISFVAVPAQRAAGVIKCQKSFSADGGQESAEDDLNMKAIKEQTDLRIRIESEMNYVRENEINEYEQKDV